MQFSTSEFKKNKLHAQCYAKRSEHEINFVTWFLSSLKQICFSEAIGGLQRHAPASRINIVFSQQKQRTVAWLWSDSKISVCVGKDDIFEKHMLELKKKIATSRAFTATFPGKTATSPHWALALEIKS